jgi:hypothetical protein
VMRTQTRSRFGDTLSQRHFHLTLSSDIGKAPCTTAQTIFLSQRPLLPFFSFGQRVCFSK